MIEPWLFPLDLPATELARLERLLAPDERARAAAFRHDLHRDRFVARRGQLRLLLGQAAGMLPERLRFGAGQYGKPCLLDRPGIGFNMSSAGALGLCVLAPGAEVGCDIARDEAVPDALEIARRLFARGEHRALRAIAPARRDRAFLAVWTRKEAYLKAVGTGLHQELDAFEVPAGDGADAAVVGAPGGWRLAAVPLAAPYVAAVAARSPAPLRVDPARPFTGMLPTA